MSLISKLRLFLLLLLLLLFPATIFWYFTWKATSTHSFKHDQYERSFNSHNDWKKVPEVSMHKNFNSSSSSDVQHDCPSTEEPADDSSAGDKLEKRLPSCLIIGFAKCGTYALKSFLTLHPQIVCPDKEMSFFTTFYSKGLGWYLRQMPVSSESSTTIEKTPNYILSEKALLRIKAFNASIKLIVSVRDPVTRLQSSFAHAQATGKLLNETFESWLAQDTTIARVADYETHIRTVFHLFNRSQVLLLTEERLERNPLSVMRDVEQFLGLCHAFTDELLRFDRNKGFYCFNQSSPRYSRIAQTLKLNRTSGCFTSSKGRAHPEIGKRLLRKLVEKVSPYNIKLSALVGQRFNWTN